MNSIAQYNLPEGVKPEQFFHNLLIDIDTNDDELAAGELELIGAAQDIHAVDDHHAYLYDICRRLGLETSVGFDRIMRLVASKKCEQRVDYTANVKATLEAKFSRYIESGE